MYNNSCVPAAANTCLSSLFELHRRLGARACVQACRRLDSGTTHVDIQIDVDSMFLVYNVVVMVDIEIQLFSVDI